MWAGLGMRDLESPVSGSTDKQCKLGKERSVYEWGMGGRLWHGMARYGVVWFGWLCCWKPSPRPLPPVPLWGPSWEGPLFRAGRRTNEWMSKSGGGPLQWRLFVYTSQSRHTSLAAQPTDNLWCPNRRWVCGCPSAQDKGVSRIPDTHIPTRSSRLHPQPLVVHIHTHTCTHIQSPWWGRMGEVVLSSWAKRHREVSRHQWSSNSPRELALHHRDVRDLPPRKTQKQDRVIIHSCYLLTTITHLKIRVYGRHEGIFFKLFWRFNSMNGGTARQVMTRK